MKKNENKLPKDNVQNSSVVPEENKESSAISHSEPIVPESINNDENRTNTSSSDSTMSSNNSDYINSNIKDEVTKNIIEEAKSSDYPENYGLDLAVLNEISRTCQLAMNNISYLTNRIFDLEMKKDLVAIYSQYANVLKQVIEHFEKYGEVPECISLSCKIMGFCGIKLDTIRDRSNSHIADIMIQGSLLGIIKCQKILNSALEIEKSTTELLKNFNKFQRQNIDKLNAYL